LRKAVPLALVLIAGAAVVLWFGNRLNSWVLGGLIGGLASLLLSIPISLALFAYFTRQHDEYEQYSPVVYKRLRSRRSIPLPDYSPHEIDARYHDDEYALVDGEISAVVEEHYQPPTARKNSGWLDEEFGSPIPPARQLPPAASSRHTTRNTSGRYPSAPYGMPPGRQTGDAEEEYRTRRATPRRTAYPGLPGSQQASFRSRFLSQAMRTARLEAVQQYVDEHDVSFGRRSSRYMHGRHDDNQTE
jgi:hypothetical protein